MPIKKAALKQIRKSKKRRLRNLRITSELKTIIKKFSRLISSKDMEGAKELLPQVIGKIDRACSKGVISKNTASRKKSRLTKRLNLASLSAKT